MAEKMDWFYGKREEKVAVARLRRTMKGKRGVGPENWLVKLPFVESLVMSSLNSVGHNPSFTRRPQSGTEGKERKNILQRN